MKLKLVDLPQVMDLIRSKPPLVHLVLTGRDAHSDVIEAADTVSEVTEIKHAYRQGIEPQKGIDYEAQLDHGFRGRFHSSVADRTIR